MNETPLISVIVPIYNVEKYVRKCLDSLRSQTMKQIEVICIDDGSTDESGKIADEYKNEEGWPRFRVIHTENRGLSAARNIGLDEAKADWIMFVDSDDWVDERFCEIPWKTKEKSRSNLVGNVMKSLINQGFAGFWRRANLRVFVSWKNGTKDISGGRHIRNRGLGILHHV